MTLIEIQLVLRKIAHLTEYAILASLLWRAVLRGMDMPIRKSILILAILLPAAIFAVSDEFHQSFMLSRTGSPRDVMIDIVGACIGIAICWAVSKRRSTAAFAKGANPSEDRHPKMESGA